MPDGDIFSSPVDPIAQKCPTYPDIVKEPMDMGTGKSLLVCDPFFYLFVLPRSPGVSGHCEGAHGHGYG
jgi:hypothetical protein